MSDPRAGTPALPDDLVDVSRLITAYYTEHPDPDDPAQQVSFGTSGHRGSSLRTSFNDDHIAATTQAICEYRAGQGIDGPLLIGRDTHGLSEPAYATALEVLVANGVQVLVDSADGFVPTPAISHAILTLNREGRNADGIVITPSHNPPSDGGFKYNPPDGGPADTAITKSVQDRANALLRAGLQGVRRVPLSTARASLQTFDFISDYVDDLPTILDIEAIKAAGVRIGADPLGGASVAYWGAIADRFGLDLTVVNPRTDPQFAFMTLDWDGKIRMDCSSPSAMASLVAAKDQYQVATGNDADSDRHGIVTPDAGLMNPNHYLSVAIDYLLSHRPGWSPDAAVGKTLVSSSMIDRVVRARGRQVLEVPVGFKWFVPGLLSGDVVFGGEESAGASFLRKDGTTWTTDKDGILLALLASEIIAVTGESPSRHYAALTEQFGTAYYARIDAPATRDQKAKLAALSADQVTATELAGDAITKVLTEAPGNGAPIGGLKVETDRAWFAARPSGTEDVYKIYAESWISQEHLGQVQDAARALVTETLA
ncbi:MAG: alpha-D-glucose phosphate-specific phosphoglucomutase [Actinobacteria bacterium]|nr:phosphoglucomutase (alpha-D-glucose-1,6-bisphosphate-dependent) [Actinomycetota bacterium]MCB8997620.1 alpha-D-glucose phosphate-specific phosphoglucomutase [Actinomycetota bacterium]MCB9414557.1 alpha-D-glucose phosphate-specific phosphoglucomutase [Actinomycetota bacterium]MCB9423853.1 alpha-D-glucose phosphate-specific phosphoglucomutase [Actinomycetota bacterium]HRY09139.1 phosphoglucomutase (alpha-D-glucose-1,6-bisphosphate-dependent) [Candidatus Nanopelagicales bacterium]